MKKRYNENTKENEERKRGIEFQTKEKRGDIKKMADRREGNGKVTREGRREKHGEEIANRGRKRGEGKDFLLVSQRVIINTLLEK